MAFIKATSTDDLGKKIELLAPSSSLLKDDPELGVTLARVSESIYNTGSPLSLQRIVPLLLGILAVAIVAVTTTLISTSLPPWVPGLTVGAVMFVVLRIGMAASRRRHPTRIVESLLRIGRCPCCGYDLRQMVRQESGACVCPECGAGWKFERVGHARVPASDLPTRPEMAGDTPPVSGVWFRMTSRTPTIVDDRDRSLPCVDLALPGIENEVGAVRALALRDEVHRATLPGRAGCSVLIFLFGLLWLANVVFMFSKGRVGGLVGVGLAFGIFMLVVYSMIAFRIWRGRARFVSKLLAVRLKSHRVCPSCGTDLAGVRVEEDGCTLCGKCGAAWKLRKPDLNPTPLFREP